MYNPKDCWHIPYYLPNLQLNPNCRLSSGCTEKQIKVWLRKWEEERVYNSEISEISIMCKKLLKKL